MKGTYFKFHKVMKFNFFFFQAKWITFNFLRWSWNVDNSFLRKIIFNNYNNHFLMQKIKNYKFAFCLRIMIMRDMAQTQEFSIWFISIKNEMKLHHFLSFWFYLLIFWILLFQHKKYRFLWFVFTSCWQISYITGISFDINRN